MYLASERDDKSGATVLIETTTKFAAAADHQSLFTASAIFFAFLFMYSVPN